MNRVVCIWLLVMATASLALVAGCSASDGGAPGDQAANDSTQNSETQNGDDSVAQDPDGNDNMTEDDGVAAIDNDAGENDSDINNDEGTDDTSAGDDIGDADNGSEVDENTSDEAGDGDDADPTPAPTPTAARYFPDDAMWYRDVSDAALDGQSDAVIAWIANNGGFGLGRMQIDFSIEVLEANASTPAREFEPTWDWYEVECDLAAVPVPDGGALEGEEGYQCTSDGDCHLIVADRTNQRLYEMWRANIVDGEFFGGCLAIWDMSRTYGPAGRGYDCTSADAAGFPIAPLLFSADEVAAGSVDHAIRFILPNARIRNRVYVSPATHSTGATGGGGDAPPYGARFRLRADFPLESLPNEATRVVARGLQRYGMFLADAGNVALTAQSDRFTTAKWDGLLGSRDLDSIQITDFEMVEGGERISYTGDCVREP